MSGSYCFGPYSGPHSVCSPSTHAFFRSITTTRVSSHVQEDKGNTSLSRAIDACSTSHRAHDSWSVTQRLQMYCVQDPSVHASQNKDETQTMHLILTKWSFSTVCGTHLFQKTSLSKMLKSTSVVDKDTAVYDVHTYTVAFSPAV